VPFPPPAIAAAAVSTATASAAFAASVAAAAVSTATASAAFAASVAAAAVSTATASAAFAASVAFSAACCLVHAYKARQWRQTIAAIAEEAPNAAIEEEAPNAAIEEEAPEAETDNRSSFRRLFFYSVRSSILYCDVRLFLLRFFFLCLFAYLADDGLLHRRSLVMLALTPKKKKATHSKQTKAMQQREAHH
jgi:hypothetical protein